MTCLTNINEWSTATVPKNHKKAKEVVISLKNWEKQVLLSMEPRNALAEIEDELRLAAGLTGLRERAGVSQREDAW